MPASVRHAVLAVLLIRAVPAALPATKLAEWATEAPAHLLPLVEQITGKHLARTPR